MQCPKCRKVISEASSSCPNCGHDLSLYHSIALMSDDLVKIKADAFALSKKIDLMQSRFVQLERQIPKHSPEDEFHLETQKESQSESGSAPKGHGQQMPAQKQERPVAPPPRPAGSRLESELRPTECGESEVKFGQKWLLIAGVILTVLAVGWFLKYSFEQNWIGPAGRVSLAYLMGIGFLCGGEFFRRRDFDVFGLYLIGGGIATLYFATFSAFHIYHLLSQATAFGIMALVTALAGVLSLIYDTKWLAVLGLVGGFVTPVILSTGKDNQVALMTYMMILNSGILSIAFFKQWRLLNYLGFLLTWLLFTGWYANHYVEQKFWKTTVFLNIFFLTYAFVPFVYHLLKEHGKQLRGIELTMPNAFIAFGYSFAMIKGHYSVEFVSIVTLIYAAIFLWMARFIFERDHEQLGAFVMMIAKATLFLVLTVPILFSKHWITFFWAIQALALLWSSLKLQNQWLYGSFAILLVLSILKFLFYDYSEIFRLQLPDIYYRSGYTRLFLERFITSASVLASVFLSLVLKKSKVDMGFSRDKDRAVLWGVLIVMLFLVLNIEIKAFFHDYASQAGFAAISVLWAAFSIVLMMFGFLKTRSSLRICAIGIFGVTLIKVFFVDMANVSTPYRVVSFMILGLMLIAASYLYHRFKDRILAPSLKEEPTG